MKLTHAILVEKAARWLANTRRCALVLQEANCWAVGEFPDAIGWNIRGESILVECKMSRSDFHADKRKPAKRNAHLDGRETMGRERWYLTPPALLAFGDLSDGAGLLELRAGRIARVVEASNQERPGRQSVEMPLLIHAARKEAWAGGWKGRMVRLACKVAE